MAVIPAVGQMADTPPQAPGPSEPMLPLPFRAPQEPRNHVSIGVGFTGGINATFHGVGRVPPPALPGIDEAGAKFIYRDGFVEPDDLYKPDADPAFTDTAYWAYDSLDQIGVVGGDNVVFFHEYGSAILTDLDGTSKAGTSHTWELKFERELGRIGRARWGFLGGFSIGGSDVNRSETLTGDLLVVRDTYNFGSRPVPKDEDDTGPWQSPNNQRPSSTATDPNPELRFAPLTPSNRENIIRADEAIVVGNYELSAAFYHFRVGPTVILPIGQKFGLTASAGVAATVASSRFTANETLLDDEANALVTFSGSNSERDIAVGAYAESQVFYRINRGLSIYTGLNYVGTSANFETRIDDEKYANLDMSSSFSMTAGFRFSF